MDRLQRFVRALYDPFAQRCLHCLLRGPLCLCDLQSALKASSGHVQACLRRLAEADIVALAEGPHGLMFCSLNDQHRHTVESLFSDFEQETIVSSTYVADFERLELQLALRADGDCSVRLSKRG